MNPSTHNIQAALPSNASRLPGARPTGPGSLPGSSGQLTGRAFAERLGKFQRETDAQGDPARNTAKTLIAQGLILPLMKMARQSQFKTGMFHGGQGEKAFGAQLDQRLARRVAENLAPGLVDAVYRQVHGIQQKTAPATPKAPTNATDPNATPRGSAAQPTRPTGTGKEVDRHG